ncbi:YidH family protein [Oricola sp.]|uniref:YidH family protein n=1 Tax=Oricola sp. TaxID=1979950 RepID=UPI00320BB684|nr:DUF202 domain-containing protein [Oricola sp.]
MIPRYSDHAANERTFLSWVRTVIAIEGFGIAAARIGGATTQLWTEAALLASGGLVIVLAFLRMRLIRRRIETADPVDDQAPLADALLLLLVAALMALIAAFGFHVS